MNLLTPSYIGVAIIGLLHGLEPGHGWPVALVYSMTKKNPLLSGIISSGIIAFAHFTSSIAVAVAYVLLSSWLKFDLPYLDYVAAALLLWLAYRMFREKVGEADDHHSNNVMSLWTLASFAFVLGFGHEEEFALLALVVAGANPFVLMALYGLAVSVAIVGVTLASVKIYGLIEPKIKRYEKYIPRISGVVLVIMAVYIIFW